jgi:Tol biopolymer transport system component
VVADLPGRVVVLVDGQGIEVRTPDGSTLAVLDPVDDALPAQQPTWSPDGSRLAWASFDDDGRPAVRIGDVDGNSEAVVQGLPTAPFYFQWSPDGSRLVWMGAGRGRVIGGIVPTDGNGDGAATLTSGGTLFVDWLPDSTGLVTHAGQATLELVVSGSEPIVLVRSTGPFGAPEVLPDGTVLSAGAVESSGQVQVAWGRDLESARVPLELISTPGGARTPVAAVPGTLVRFDVDPAGSRAAVWSVGSSWNTPLVVVDLRTGAIEQLLDDDAHGAQWSPDGSALAVLRRIDADHLAWGAWRGGEIDWFEPFEPTNEFIRGYLPFLDQYVRSVTPWSPDGRALVHTLVGDDGPTVVVQPVEPTGERVRVGRGDAAWWSPG